MSPAEKLAREIRSRVKRVGGNGCDEVRLSTTLTGYGDAEIAMFASDVAKAVGDREARFSELPTPANGECVAFDGVIVRSMRNSDGQTQLAVGFTVR